jgi:tight adherence protein B
VNPGLAAVLCLLLGGGFLLAHTVSATALRRRLILQRVAALGAIADGAPREHDPDRAAPQDSLMRLLTVGMQQTWGVKRSARSLLTIGGAVALTTLLAGLALKLPVWIALPAGLGAGFFVGRLLIATEQARAEVSFTEHFPSALDTVIRALRAGLPTRAAIGAVADDAPEAVANVFADLANQLEIGVPMGVALNKATARIHLSDFRFFAVSAALQHSTGGNLASTLETLSEIIRSRRGVRKKVKALTAEVRMSSYVLAAIPLLVLGGLSIIAPHYLEPLFHDPRGKVILGVAAFNLAAGLLAMRVLMRRVVAN